MNNKDLPAMPKRKHLNWFEASVGDCDCGHHGRIISGMCADCHDAEYQQEREQVLIDRIVELQSQGNNLTKKEYFAAHAPDMPEKWISDFKYTREEKNNISESTADKVYMRRYMRALVSWRWHYADMMLENGK